MTGQKPAGKAPTGKTAAAGPRAASAATSRRRSATGKFVKAADAPASATKATKAGTAKAAPGKGAPAKARTTKAQTSKARTTKAASTKPVRTRAATPATEPEGATDGPIELFFVRHADAGDPLTWVGDDAERPLSKKGRRQAKRLGRLLDGLGAQVDAVLSSPKVRATETASLVARPIGTSWVADDRLGADFGDDALGPLLAGLAPGVSSVMLVGHDPDFSRAVSWLVGTSIEMRKGALARVSLPDRNVGAGRGSLRWLLPPDAVAR